MQNPNRPPVVVGVNGTAAGLAAVRLAAREAVSRGRVLHVVHAFTWPDPRPGTGVEWAPARRAASRVVEEAVVTAQRSTPGVDARGHLVDGPAARVLRELSHRAALLVLGGDDLAATGRLPPGSPLLEVVAQAWCPVVVARGPRPPSGRVLAAVDGSAPSLLALRHAAEDAARRGVALDVLHVAGEDAEEAGERLLDETLAAVPGLPPLRRWVLTGAPAAVLIRASRRAGLITLGSRGTGGAARLGSVAHQLLLRGGCPVVFAHGRRLPSRHLPPPDREAGTPSLN
ncbi:universal stress protein [Actinoplanes teichomyceticus]|uniref:Nucleotide-binding universal stress UspA family protein n=1 Tax=Actinoplanes teichomyceticus TaxID=1867 RepID=A0A561W9T9_ACTTI|nr:universal stress protein [Actinoplanes teichomyceticus]TWG20613.1 nucleotide-binding universal stress UspA family protein [Actinoplanes teichomyceticus]GIF15948.1 universal stress protein [Actinoplanes teichomyceticus]